MVNMSVVIPTKNRVELLKRSINSVKSQQNVNKIELIIVDDGDPTLREEVLSLTQKNEGRYFYTGGNKGGAVARNIGIENAVGEYVAFLDDDDEWVSQKLSTQIEILNKTSSAMCYTAITVKNQKDRSYYVFHKPKENQYKSIMKKNFIGSISSVVIKKEILKKLGGFDPALPALQDYDLYIRILKDNFTSYTEHPLTIYYSDSSENKVSESLDKFLMAKKILLNKYIGDPFFPYLRRNLIYIFFLKCFRSRKFLFDTFNRYICKK